MPGSHPGEKHCETSDNAPSDRYYTLKLRCGVTAVKNELLWVEFLRCFQYCIGNCLVLLIIPLHVFVNDIQSGQDGIIDRVIKAVLHQKGGAIIGQILLYSICHCLSYRFSSSIGFLK